MPNHTLKVTIGSYTDKGVKEENEDSFGAFIPNKTQLVHKGIALAIADGMSGSDAGKEASECCVLSFLNDYFSTPDSWTVKNSAQKVLSATNTWLYSQGQHRYQSTKGMVSTLSTLVLKSTTGHIFHIGDSRIYRLRQGNLELLTRDHRLELSENKNYLTRAMGIEPSLQADYKAFPLELNDLFLMTTDGVHDFISEKFLKKCLNANSDLDSISKILVKHALDEGSDDNLCCQLVRIEELPAANEDEIFRRHANLSFPPPLDPGMIIDGYRIVAELHASSRTQIYKAVDTQTNAYVVLKTPSVLYEDDNHYIEHFLHEEWAAKRIQHKNVLNVLGADRKRSFIYYVTEYVEGQTLREWMNSHQKPLIREVRPIIEQVAKGLNAMHKMEMLHQDLKPENIMITLDGSVKIIDFGSVKIAGISEITPLENQQESQENILGTLNYTAPEYHMGQRGSIQSDLYSLGVITYEMINKALPYGKDMPEKPNKMNLSKLQYVPSIYLNPMVPLWIDGALKKATQINPQVRYKEISEFIHDMSNPNPVYLKEADFTPLIERNPLIFWKGLSGLLFLSNLILLALLIGR